MAQFWQEGAAMKPEDQKRLLREIRQACKAHAISVTVEPAKGDHIAIIFTDTHDVSIKLVWDGKPTVSPGVLRRSIAYLNSVKASNIVARIVLEIILLILE